MAIESAAVLPWITVDWSMLGRSSQQVRCQQLEASLPLVASLHSAITRSATVPVVLQCWATVVRPAQLEAGYFAV